MKKLIVSLSVICFFTFVSISLIVPSFAKGKDEAKGQTIIGNVHEVKSDKIVVEEKKDKRKEETIIDSLTKFMGHNKKTLKLKEIKLKDMIAIIATDSGEIASDGAKIKKALKVFVKDASQSAQFKRRAVHGIISDIDGSLITLVHQIHQDRVFQVVVDITTVVKIKGIENASISNLAVGQRIVAVGDISGSGAILAKRIHVIPGKAKGVFRRSGVEPGITATPSVSLTVTPTSTVSGGI